MDRQTLQELYINQKLTIRAIAKKYNCSMTPVRRLLIKYNIPIRKPKRLNINKSELIDLYHNKGMSLLEIAKLKGAAFQSIHDLMVKWDIERREYGTKGLKFPGRKLTEEQRCHLSIIHTGKKLSKEHRDKVVKNLELSWVKSRLKNGTIVEAHSGYKKIKKNNEWEYLHRKIAEEKIGRKLKKNEVVHHINLDKKDNRPENLMVLDRIEHLNLHASLKKMESKLVKDKKIVLKDGEYIANL